MNTVDKRNIVTMCFDLFMYGAVHSNYIKFKSCEPDFDLFEMFIKHLILLNHAHNAIPADEMGKAIHEAEPEMRKFIKRYKEISWRSWKRLKNCWREND